MGYSFMVHEFNQNMMTENNIVFTKKFAIQQSCEKRKNSCIFSSLDKKCDCIFPFSFRWSLSMLARTQVCFFLYKYFLGHLKIYMRH